MYFFADTNIPIGYTVIHDKWHEPSKKFINNNENHIFWSNLVMQEYGDKLDVILDCVDEFLKSIISILKKNEKDFYNYHDFENFVIKRTRFCKLDSTKKHKILEQFWQNNNFIIGFSSKVFLRFINFADDFEEIYFQRDIQLNNIMKLHNCGLDNYLKYHDYALKLYKAGIHSPDCKIIVDAHDCGISHDDLVFVSNDEKMLEILSNHDCSYLNILEFKSCNN